MIRLSLQKQLQSATGKMLLDVELQVEKGQLVTLYGKSGAGKTSILRMLAGLLRPDSGHIVVNGSIWLDTEKQIYQPPQKRKVGFVFQDYALFPNMTVLENLQFALQKGQDKSVVQSIIDIVELGALQHRKPNTLSGGQQQRVALARSLVQRPQLLMLDEPLSALDHDMRVKLQEYILKVHREFGLTTLLISHDISEILKMSDIIVELDEGKVIRQGLPSKVFMHREVGGKFQFHGEVLALEHQDFMVIVTILIGKDLVKVVVVEEEGRTLRTGDKVVVASKAFNPVIRKMG